MCSTDIAAGDRAGWDPKARTTTCIACLSASEPIDTGQVGGSAARTYKRRADRHQQSEQRWVEADQEWRRTVREEHPVLGRVVTALTPEATAKPEPSHVRSWAAGAPGEVRVGEVLDGIEGIVALHDRRVPRSRSNIDHIAVTPAAVWVIDTKRYAGATVEYRNAGGWLRVDERLIVGGRDRTKLVEAMEWQVAAIRDAAADQLPDAVPVRPALCFVGSNWGLFTRRPFLVQGVAVCWPNSLPEILSRPGPLDQNVIRAVALALATSLPRA